MTTLLMYRQAGINKFKSAKKRCNFKEMRMRKKSRQHIHTHARRKKAFVIEMIGPVQWNRSDTVSSYCGCEADAIEIEGLCFIFRSNCQLPICCLCFLFTLLCTLQFCRTSRAICKFSSLFFQKQILTIEKCLIKSKMRREHCVHISLYAAHIDIFRSKCKTSKKSKQSVSVSDRDEKKVNCSNQNQRVCWCEA